MEYVLITARTGDDQHTDLTGQILADPELVARMWADAEHRPEDLRVPGATYVFAAVEHGGRLMPAAWAGAVEITDDGRRTLKAFCNYEHPRWRGHGLYAAAYAERHRQVVQPAGLPGVTYLFRQPIWLHEQDGWRRTGMTDVSNEPDIPRHRWWQLRRDPS